MAATNAVHPPATDPEGTRFHRLVADGAADVHTVTTVGGVYLFVSTASLVRFGWAPTDLVGGLARDFTHPDDAALVDRTIDAVTAHPDAPLTTVARFRCADGAFRWTETSSQVVRDGSQTLIVSTIRDIGDRRRTELDLRRRATTDPLTGVSNRAVFTDRLQQALRRVQRREGLVAVLFLDLDRFKLINDTLGHHIGDAVLLQMAERLRAFLRPQDTLARLGGDEFAIVIEDFSSLAEVTALGDRIIAAGRTPFTVGDDQLVCTTSVGIAATTDADHEPEKLLREADLALYRAKNRGRDRREVFDADLRTRAVGRLGVERMLRGAIDEERLRVEYQPIIDLHTRRTVAAEALVRVWDPGAEQLVVAKAFIDVAEETGLLGPIDEWMLARVIEQAAAWRLVLSASDFDAVSINVTGRHLADAHFVPSLIDALTAHDVPVPMLQIEVTERVLMEASSSAITALTTLRDAGAKVSLDDFGTGCSSLSNLRLFPLDVVKIDGSLIRELPGAGPERAIVAAIIALSHALGLIVVAEGVETPAQLEEVVRLGSDRAQGFVFAGSGAPDLVADRVRAPQPSVPPRPANGRGAPRSVVRRDERVS